MLRAVLKLLPRGPRDALLQITIWTGFSIAYEAARGLSAGGRAEALDNARQLVRLEQHLGGLIEADLQRPVLHSSGVVLLHAANWTYWLSQFVVVMIAVVWVYLRRPGAYPRLRNTIVVANTIGLAGYVFFPLAPPRLLDGHGFVDTLARAASLNHRTGIVELFANPYAAMPSLHAADALIVGVALALVVRPWALRVAFASWPAWVSYSLVATGNHYWLDIAAGILVAVLAAWLTGRSSVGRAVCSRWWRPRVSFSSSQRSLRSSRPAVRAAAPAAAALPPRPSSPGGRRSSSPAAAAVTASGRPAPAA